jgi:hypothetical protein
MFLNPLLGLWRHTQRSKDLMEGMKDKCQGFQNGLAHGRKTIIGKNSPGHVDGKDE